MVYLRIGFIIGEESPVSKKPAEHFLQIKPALPVVLSLIC
jgi:hypothetical protein